MATNRKSISRPASEHGVETSSSIPDPESALIERETQSSESDGPEDSPARETFEWTDERRGQWRATRATLRAYLKTAVGFPGRELHEARAQQIASCVAGFTLNLTIALRTDRARPFDLKSFERRKAELAGDLYPLIVASKRGVRRNCRPRVAGDPRVAMAERLIAEAFQGAGVPPPDAVGMKPDRVAAARRRRFRAKAVRRLGAAAGFELFAAHLDGDPDGSSPFERHPAFRRVGRKAK